MSLTETKALNKVSSLKLNQVFTMKTLATEIHGHRATMIFVDGYIRYSDLESIENELDTSLIEEFVIVSGKMPSWYSLAIVALLTRKYNVKAIGIFRPPANKILIVYSEFSDVGVNEWIEPTKRQLEFLRSGEIYA